MNTTLNSASAAPADGPSLLRISQVLRGILRDNPGVKTFNVERILASIGDGGFEASLVMFSIPAIVSVPRPTGMVALPTGAIACQMAAGCEKIRLPRFIRKKSISRRALAVAIHAMLPVLEAAEKVVRPRWTWVNHTIWRRLIGLFVLVMVLAIAFPLFGFNAFHASSIFVIALGMAEKDGLAVMIGVAVGVLSLAVIASGISLRAARSKIVKWVLKVTARLGLAGVARHLDRLGHKFLAQVLRLRWSTLLMKWDPERRAAEGAKRAARTPGAPTRRAPTQDRSQPGSVLVRRARLSSAAAVSLSSALA